MCPKLRIVEQSVWEQAHALKTDKGHLASHMKRRAPHLLSRRHLLDRMSVVARSVVDAHADWANCIAGTPDGRLQAFDIAHITVLEMGSFAKLTA